MEEIDRIVFLTNFYYPTPLANGVCVHSIAKELAKSGNEVYVVCLKKWHEKRKEVYEGVNVLRIPMPFYQKLLFFADRKKAKWYSYVARSLGTFLSRIKKALHYKEYPLRDMSLVRHYVKECKSLIRKKNVNKIIGVYTPIESIKAGAIIKKKYPNIKSYYYSLDTLSNEKGYGLLSSNKRSMSGFKNESHYFGIYDTIILMNCHRQHYFNDLYAPYIEKYRFSDFPLFQEQREKKKTVFNKTQKNIVFTGSLYKEIRDPEKALELLSYEIPNVCIHFYGYSNCIETLDEYIRKFPNNIIDHGLVSHEKALDALYDADILLSIGNHNTHMVPSKIYEYISTGKPIIHIYSDSDDPCLEVLCKYGNAFCARNLTNESVNNLHAFIISSQSIDVLSVKDSFIKSTPGYTADIISQKVF